MFKKHCKNVMELEKAIDLIDANIRASIRYKRADEEKIYTKLYCFLIVSWLEIRLLKLINEPSNYKDKGSSKIFDQKEQEFILNKKHSLFDKWIVTLNLSAEKAYKIQLSKNKLELKKTNGQKTFELRYKYLISTMSDEFQPIITVRNKIGHGQLLFAFNNIPIDFSQEQTSELHKINLIDLRFKKIIFENIANIIHDLTVSPVTFERDYDKYYYKIENSKNNVKNQPYNIYKKKLIEKQNKYRKNLSQNT